MDHKIESCTRISVMQNVFTDCRIVFKINKNIYLEYLKFGGLKEQNFQ